MSAPKLKAPLDVPLPAGADYLQGKLDREFPLVKHIGIAVEAADERGVRLSAPLAANANHQGTAFGGSLYCVAVLAGWGWLTHYLDVHQLGAAAVIQESTIRYIKPVQGALRATLTAPAADEIERFRKMLRRAGRGRINLHVDILDGGTLAAEFDGVFAAS
ncbi:MAG TPA: YiiD C-terminal domain-containing protein [Steroidobacteraceae bacterium]|nr:YiiD C-terminal domain-containing protein [Steroidobacteraceae bacterium]